MRSKQQQQKVNDGCSTQLDSDRIAVATLEVDDATATVNVLTGLAPREMRMRIRLACGQAAQAGRLVVLPSDLPADARQGHRMGL